jgi:hypothetical protein
LPKSRTIHTGVLRVHSNTSLVPQQVRGAHMLALTEARPGSTGAWSV